jgi:sec-independent protein translocase protein TatB
MFGLSFTEVVILAILALILLGPEQLPSAARTLGKGLRELRKATDDLKGHLESEMAEVEGRIRPTLVPPVPRTSTVEIPRMPVPDGSPAPAAAENVPGLEAARVELPPPAQAAQPTGTDEGPPPGAAQA